ncbi:hypothetical protein BCR44DRAFT_1423746 [Catenaria anguillulae PL171]|uniref:Uncharacterized protein n=1 Tax=Catenaria anguillulae PL171 TaxID=765915 RepID=A0A1Y2I487_9FUNG|nr:hypothetical protein BCR44DRAFT_1423746 [Catenaria anguillulae PL171]
MRLGSASASSPLAGAENTGNARGTSNLVRSAPNTRALPALDAKNGESESVSSTSTCCLLSPLVYMQSSKRTARSGSLTALNVSKMAQNTPSYVLMHVVNWVMASGNTDATEWMAGSDQSSAPTRHMNTGSVRRASTFKSMTRLSAGRTLARLSSVNWNHRDMGNADEARSGSSLCKCDNET